MSRRRYDALRAWGLHTLKTETMLRISVVGMTVDLLIAASTLAPGAPLVPQWPQFILFPLIFVVHFSSVLRLTPERRGWREWLNGLSRGWGLLKELPLALVLGFVVLFIGAWLVLMISIGSIGGQPTMNGGRYFLNNHGDFMPVTKAAYEHALVLQQRIFTLGPSVFFALGVLVHYPRPSVSGEAVAHA